MNYEEPDLPLCPVCNKPVALETAKVDASGHAIHSECYLTIVRKKDSEIESQSRWIAQTSASAGSRVCSHHPSAAKAFIFE